MASSDVVIDVSAPLTPVLLKGPIPVVVTVHNRSARPIEILLPYPSVNDLRFESPGALQRSAPMVSDERTVPIPIAPGQRHACTYFLNRYLRFDAPGQVRVKYHLDIPSTRGPGAPDMVHEDLVAEGELALQLIQGTNEALEEELSNRAVGLRSKDSNARLEAAEALAFLETPIALQYQARMLTIENLEVTGIEALGRSSSPQAHRLIVGMLEHRESMVVSAALAEIGRLRLDLPREKVWPLLLSENASVRWTAVDWMAAHADPRDRGPVSALLQDPVAAVRERARTYLDSLPH